MVMQALNGKPRLNINFCFLWQVWIEVGSSKNEAFGSVMLGFCYMTQEILGVNIMSSHRLPPETISLLL